MLNRDKIFLYCDRLMLGFLCLMIFCLPFSKAGIESFVWPAIFIFILKRVLGYRAGSLWGMFPKTELNMALGIFIAINALSVILSSDFALSSRGFFGKVLKFLAIYFMLVEVINSKRRLKIVLITIIASAVLIIADAGVQYFRGTDFIRGYYSALLQASFSNRNDFSGWLIVVILLLLGLLLKGGSINIILKVLLLPLILLLVLCLIATFVRGAWLGFLIGILLMISFVFSKFSLKNKVLYLSIGVSLVMFFLILPQPIKSKIKYNIAKLDFKNAITIKARVKSATNVAETGVSIRLKLWDEAIRIIKDYNFTGCGLNTYSKVARDYKSFEGGGIYPHNSYLQMAAETGLFGLFAFLWVLLVFFKTGLRHFNQRKDYLALGLLSGILAFLVQAFFDTHLYALQLVVLFWFMLGLTVAVINLEPNYLK